MVIFDRIGPHKVAVSFSNGAMLGDLVQSEDGYFHWWPPDCTQGAWPGYMLRAISDKLEELNWDREIEDLQRIADSGEIVIDDE